MDVKYLPCMQVAIYKPLRSKPVCAEVQVMQPPVIAAMDVTVLAATLPDRVNALLPDAFASAEGASH